MEIENQWALGKLVSEAVQEEFLAPLAMNPSFYAGPYDCSCIYIASSDGYLDRYVPAVEDGTCPDGPYEVHRIADAVNLLFGAENEDEIFAILERMELLSRSYDTTYVEAVNV